VDKEMTAQDFMMTLLPGVFLFLAARITGKVGYADAWIVSLIGAVEGLADCFIILTLSMILCGVFAAVLLAFRKVKAKTQIAFIPFMLVAFLVVNYLK
jgi:prepilin signal peptidase PulO-like enzyme (type II secretory pathway)